MINFVGSPYSHHSPSTYPPDRLSPYSSTCYAPHYCYPPNIHPLDRQSPSSLTCHTPQYCYTHNDLTAYQNNIQKLTQQKNQLTNELKQETERNKKLTNQNNQLISELLQIKYQFKGQIKDLERLQLQIEQIRQQLNCKKKDLERLQLQKEQIMQQLNCKKKDLERLQLQKEQNQIIFSKKINQSHFFYQQQHIKTVCRLQDLHEKQKNQDKQTIKRLQRRIHQLEKQHMKVPPKSQGSDSSADSFKRALNFHGGPDIEQSQSQIFLKAQQQSSLGLMDRDKPQRVSQVWLPEKIKQLTKVNQDRTHSSSKGNKPS